MLVLAAAGGLALPAVPAVATFPASPAAGMWIVTLRAGTGEPAAVAAEQADRLGFDVSRVYRSALSGYTARLTPNARAALARDRRVAALEPDRALHLAAQIMPRGVDRVDADLSPGAGIDGVSPPGVDVDVAVLDTGIDADHPDLDVRGGVGCAGGKSHDDRYGHGTHIAGTIAALDDSVGVVGVAPGARLWSVRVLDSEGKGSVEDLLCGIDWVTSTRTDDDPDNDIEVANLSLGGPGTDDGQCGLLKGDALHAAICRSVAAGVVYVVAAGNDGGDAANFAPSSYDEVITVSALMDSDGRSGGTGGNPECRPGRDDTFAAFSNSGADVDLIAPGVCVYSTLPLEHKDRGGGYGIRNGTSFAAPHVAGAAALFLARNPQATPAEVRQGLVDAGSPEWDGTGDPDGVHEPMLDVGKL